MEGFISLHRKLLDWEWYGDINTCRLFIHCLLKANWKDKKYRGRLIKRGTFVTSRDKLSAETLLTVKQVRRALNNLQTTNEVAIKSTPQGTEIIINNYDQYQIRANETASETANKGPTKGQRRATTNNNNKYIKEIFDQFWQSYPNKVGKAKAFDSWKKIDSDLYQGIIDHVKARASSDPEWVKDDGKYIPHPTTFLNQERWEDEHKTNVTPISSAKRFSDRFVRINTEKAKASGIPQDATDKHGNTVTFWPDGSVTDQAGRSLP